MLDTFEWIIKWKKIQLFWIQLQKSESEMEIQSERNVKKWAKSSNGYCNICSTYRRTCGRTRNNRFACKLKENVDEKSRTFLLVNRFVESLWAVWVCQVPIVSAEKEQWIKSNRIKSYRAKIGQHSRMKRNGDLITGSINAFSLFVSPGPFGDTSFVHHNIWIDLSHLLHWRCINRRLMCYFPIGWALQHKIKHHVSQSKSTQTHSLTLDRSFNKIGKIAFYFRYNETSRPMSFPFD